MLVNRLLIAIVLLVALGLSWIYLPNPFLQGVVAGGFLIGAWEWSVLAGFTHVPFRLLYLTCFIITLVIALYVSGLLGGVLDLLMVREVMGAVVACWAVFFLWVIQFPSSQVIWKSSFVRALMGLVVLVPSCMALMVFLEMPAGRYLFIYCISVVVCADTGAYVFGRLWGRRKLLLAVSPGKTCEGFVGGVFACGLLAWLVGSQMSMMPLSTRALIGVTIVVAVFSVLGDLLESMVKRFCGVKDSGRLLLSHGGVLDRIDSITAAAPVFLLFVLLL